MQALNAFRDKMRKQINHKFGVSFYVDKHGNYSVLFDTGSMQLTWVEIFLSKDQYESMQSSSEQARKIALYTKIDDAFIISAASIPSDLSEIPDKLETQQEYRNRLSKNQ